MVSVNWMRLGRFEFEMKPGNFRRITQSSAGPGWDFNFHGECINVNDDDPERFAFMYGIGLYTEAAPLPLEKAPDYTGVKLELPGFFDEATGEPLFAIDVGESHEVSDVNLLFAERDGRRYRVEISGMAPASILGNPERFELSAWAEELPDHAYPV
jgi:hypothetical protein